MKAMVLAAGFGTRLRPLTLRWPKPVIPFFGRPILLRALDALAAAGVDDAIINAHHLPERIAAAIAHAPIRTHLSPESEILDTAGALWQVRDRLAGEREFLLVNGDIVFDLALDALLAAHRSAGAAATLGLLPNPDPTRFGVVTGRADGADRIVVEQILAPGSAPAGYLYAGVAVFAGELLSRLPPGRSELVPTLLRPLAAEGRLFGARLEGAWYELGTPQDLLAAHLDVLALALRSDVPWARHLARGPLELDHALASAVHPSAKLFGAVQDCVVDEHVEVGAEARVRRALLLPGAHVAPGELRQDEVIAP